MRCHAALSTALGLLLLWSVRAAAQPADALARGFASPPESARPHTWWHWVNGNASKAGITADLEAMKRVGIGGVQAFAVDCGITPGPVKYMSDEWRGLMAHAAHEARRLGLEMCVHNCAGWSSSGGPWVKPEHAMHVVVFTERRVEGPSRFEGALAQPTVRAGFYRDIAVLAYPTPAEGARIGGINVKAGYDRADGLLPDASAAPASVPLETVRDITAAMRPDGTLAWDLPQGRWTIVRLGYTPTGKTNHPAEAEGLGLECDKMSREAMDAHWDGMMAQVIRDAGSSAGKSLNNALIDSYEVGPQNWTPRMREEFRQRRGYDLQPYLLTLTGQAVGSGEVSERFLWDFRRTCADLFAENYWGRFTELCHEAGLLASTEPYGNGPFDDATAGGITDIPMGEFWIGGGASSTCKLAASIGHTYGRRVIGAESFTADSDQGRWLQDPYSMKALGDLVFTLGVNRYIFHRYAHQAYPERPRPGVTMGPWGFNMERTNTWWEPGAAWLKYVARCQYMLQEGLFAADVCYYAGEGVPNSLPYNQGLKALGYDYDGCDKPTLLKMTVKGGRVVLPGGMSYRVLVLPGNAWMTPQAARKVRDLVRAGATVLGPRPLKSPSLSDMGAGDAEVQRIADELWGPAGAATAGERRVGSGRVVWGREGHDVLATTLGAPPDFSYQRVSARSRVEFIHRTVGNAHVYFVSNQRPVAEKVRCTFRVKGLQPELWHADTGRMEAAPLFAAGADGRTTVTVPFGPAGSVFVVFRKPLAAGVRLASAERVGARAMAPSPARTLHIVRAVYEAVDGAGQVDVTAKVAAQVSAGTVNMTADNAAFGDPTPLHVKRLRVDYTLDGKAGTATVPENGELSIGGPGPRQAADTYELAWTPGGTPRVTAWANGTYRFTGTNGSRREVRVTNVPAPVQHRGAWSLRFEREMGAPDSLGLTRLVSWTEYPDEGVRHYSGTASYRTELNLPARARQPGMRVALDLGGVKNLARVVLNGKDLGVLWKPPFRLDITAAARPGANQLEVFVTNLWPNRLIGDQKLPPERRVTWTTWNPYTRDSPLLESGLLGPVRVEFGRTIPVPLGR